MKLGEALSVRARQAQKLDDLRNRIKANAVKQGDQTTPEDPDALLEEFIKLSTEHSSLVLTINETNAKTVDGDGTGGATLLELLTMRENLNRQRAVYEMAANAATSDRSFRYIRSELPTVPAVKSVTDLRAHVDKITGEVAQLDARIQTINWNTDI